MEYFEDLKQTKIFGLATEFECQAMMFCFKTRFKTFDKNAIIVSQGDAMEDVVLIVKGAANVEHIDSFGEISILMRLKKGELYGVESAFVGDVVLGAAVYPGLFHRYDRVARAGSGGEAARAQAAQ